MPFSVLPFNRIKEGNRVYGIVKQVNEYELVVSLPNHLTAFVSCNRVTKHLESVFKAFTSNDDEESESTGDVTRMENPPTLKEFFAVGDGVIGCIVSVEGQNRNASVKKRKRVELSLVPAVVNADISSRDLVEGLVLPVEIKSVEDKGFIVDLGLSDLDSSKTMGFLPFGEQQNIFKVGQLVQCRIGSMPKKSKDGKLGRVINLEPAGNGAEKSSGLKDRAALRPGTILADVVVESVVDGALNVLINRIHSGEIDCLNLPMKSTLPLPKSESHSGIQSNYQEGTKIPLCRVIFIDSNLGSEEKSIVLSALPSVLSSDKTRREIESMPNPELAIGRVFEYSKIVRIDPGLGVVLDLPASDSNSVGFAQVHLSRLSDEKMTKIVAPYKLNSHHACRIIDYDPFSSLCIAATAPRILAQTFLSIDNIEVGSVVRGEISSINPGLGVLVQLSERIRGLCPIAQLTETQSADALKSYRVGQKFKFRVLSTDPAARRVVLSRKKGLLEMADARPLASYDDVVLGEFYTGYVAAIKHFGCIVRFFGQLKAILPLSELNEEFVKDAKDVVFEGQVVRCRVLRLERETERMVVSLRATDAPKDLKRKSSTKEVSGEAKERVKQAKKPKQETGEGNVMVQEAAALRSPPASPEKKSDVPTMAVKPVLPSMREMEEEEMAKEELLDNFENDAAKSNVKPVSTADLLSMQEMCNEFERRLLGSPNSSIIWIQYMSILLKSMEIELARNLANRALQTISIRAEGEKLNVWIALMNLEHNFGTPQSLKGVFERACVYNDSKKVHLALARIYEESSNLEKPETIKHAEEFYAESLCKKFRQSCKVWMNLAHFHFATKKSPALARKTLTEALGALPKRKHIKATLKFAQMEFRNGSIDRGRTMFEGILASSPARLDIWSQYCDQEERHLPETVEPLRRLYTRVIHLKLSSKKAKFFFKKFLDFEKEHGDQLTVQNVKDLARKYVESSLSK